MFLFPSFVKELSAIQKGSDLVLICWLSITWENNFMNSWKPG